MELTAFNFPVDRAVERWTGLTMNDRIDRAFHDLEADGVVTGEDVGVTVEEGARLMLAYAAARPRARGYVFYNHADLERALLGEGLALGYGAIEGSSIRRYERIRIGTSGENFAPPGTDHEQGARAVGATVVKTLRAHGVPVQWDGSPATRVLIPAFPWRKQPSARSARCL